MNSDRHVWLRYGVYAGGEVVEKARELGMEIQFPREKSEV